MDVNNMKKKLREARLKSGYSAAEVARRVGVSRSAVSAWENQSKATLPSKDNLKSLAVLYETTVDHLIDFSQSNVVAAPDLVGSVPLISFADIRIKMDIHDILLVQKHLFCPLPCGQDTFVTKVSGDSMRSDNSLEKSYAEGTYIYCDPDAKLTNGCKIIAILESGRPIFREYRSEDGRTWLRALNRDYPHIQESFVTIAVVIGSFVAE